MRLVLLCCLLAACASNPDACREQCNATSHQLGRPLHATWELVHPLPGESVSWTVCRCEEGR